ncbi:transcriptional regulator [Rhodospirillales bacterium TMPK1]|uniref:Transcriptional regulator n=2 Tax=Roseiterribacter gracilis TaxID=2812848 RepID=A0A8S8XKF6_9PROT|nr:transcriptional regulator [Rhodospirillales bacterium TMPK1]
MKRGDDGEVIAIEPRAMDVLVALCERPGDVLSAHDLLRLCWDGLVVGDNQVHKAILQLRRALGDTASDARYIENIRKRGYRTVATVTPLTAGERHAGEDWSQESPYVGLDPFDASHEAVFFGRDAAIVELVETTTAQIDAGRALVLVLGPSGSGKTSLVQAGLVPALFRSPHNLRVSAATTLDLGDVGEIELSTAVGGALLDLDVDGESLFDGMSAEALGEHLLAAPAAISPTAPADTKFVLFVDRLEALFNSSMVDEQQRSAFLTILDGLARAGNFIVIAACRNDFYPNVANEPLLMLGKSHGGHFDLEPPTRPQIAQMIRRPAQVAGLRFGADPDTKAQLDDLLCDAAANSPDALPLLQYTLQELYRLRSNSRELTFAAYQSLGGIDGAIGRRAEAVLTGLPDAAQASLPHILSMIVTVGAQDEAVRSHRAPWSLLKTDDERRLVRTLVEQRLFVSFVFDREPVFGVAHEALLRQWPRVVAWIASHRQALHTRSRLQGVAQRWISDGRRTDLLLPRGKPLEEARDLLVRAEIPVDEDVRALVTASDRRARNADRMRIGAVAGFAFIALVAVALGLRANYAESLAAKRRLEAEDLMNFMVGDFADKLRPLGKLDLLDGVTQKALQYLANEDVARTPTAARLQQAKALQTLAEVSRSRGAAADALQALNQAELLLLANVAAGQHDNDVAKNLGAVFFWQGQIAVDQGRLDEAERKLLAYQDETLRMNAIDPANPDAWIELSYARSSLGVLLQKKGEAEKAAALFEGSIALKQRALGERPKDQRLQAELANSFSWLASAKAAMGELQATTDLYKHQRAALEELQTAEPNASVWSYRLAIANKVVGGLLALQGRTDEAVASLNISEDGLRAILLKEPTNRIWQRERSITGLQTARILVSTGKTQAALEKIRASESSLVELQSIDKKSDEIPRGLAVSHYLQALIAFNNGDMQTAEVQANKSEEILNSIYEKYRTDRFVNAELAHTMLLKARILDRGGRRDASIDLCKTTISNLSSVSGRERDFRIADPWVRANICAGDAASVAHVVAFMKRIGYNDADYSAFVNQ